MLIFRVLLLICFSYCQKSKIIIKTLEKDLVKDSLKIHYNNIDNYESYFELESFTNNPNISYYNIKNETKNIDSIIVNIKTLKNKSIFDQIISPYSNLQINENLNNIGKKVKSRYYFLIEPPFHELKLIDSSRVGLEIYLNPIFENYASAIIGLSENSNKWDLTGEFTVHMENYLDQAELLNVYWRKTDSLSHLFRFNIFFPHPLGNKVGLNWKHNFESINKLYTKIENRYILKTFSTLFDNIEFGYMKGEIKPTSVGKNNGYFKNSFQGILFASAKDSRNNRFMPTKGFYLKNEVDIGLQNQSTFVQIMNTLHMFNIAKNKFLFNMKYLFKGLFDFNGNIPKSLYYNYGGASTLRGFKENQFSSPYFQILTLEQGLKMNSTSQIKLFVDFASNRVNFFDRNQVGYGIGFYQSNNNSLIHIEYAINNLSSDNNKIHFKFVSKF